MRSRLLLILGLIPFMAINIGLAQDPLKVESTHYKLAFENEQVQVVSIHYGPHEKSILHHHPAGVVVNLTDGHLRFTDQNGTTQEVRAIHGEARWFPPVSHKVENLSNTAYDGVYIGVKGKTNASAGLTPAETNKILLSVLQAQSASR